MLGTSMLLISCCTDIVCLAKFFRGCYGTLLALAMVVAKTVMMMRMKMGHVKRQVATENEAQEKYSQDDS